MRASYNTYIIIFCPSFRLVLPCDSIRVMKPTFAIAFLFAITAAIASAQPVPATPQQNPGAGRQGGRGGGPPMPPGANPNSQYRLGPDSMPWDDVPKGEIRGPYTLPSKIYPGTQHTYWVYVPAQYDPRQARQSHGLSGWPGIQGRERRSARAERDGQPDLPARDSGYDRRIYQSWPHAGTAGAYPEG